MGCRALHCLTGGPAARYMSLLLTPSPTQYLRNYVRLRNLLTFNPDNPTWHYQLNLGNPSDNMVADQLLMLDRWEVEIDKSLGRVDVSQFVNRSHLRNMEH